MQIIHQMTMDLAVPLPVLPVTAVQGDGNTRVLAVTLLENGEPWQIPANAVVDVAFRKADGTKGIYSRLPDGSDATSREGNILHATLAPQLLTCPGAVLATVVFRTEGNKTLAAFPFTVTVAANPGAGAEVSEDYFNPTELSDLRAEIAAKAPAGFGLGESVPKNTEDIDGVENTGFYRWYNRTDAIPYGWYYGTFIDYGNDDGFMRMKQYGGTFEICRSKIGGVWQPWEWDNPPMSAGVEYRTTERYCGKPVYTKLVNTGNLASSGDEVINFATNSTTTPNIVRYTAIGLFSDIQRDLKATSFITDIYATVYSGGFSILIRSNSAVAANYTAALQVWYTKD